MLAFNLQGSVMLIIKRHSPLVKGAMGTSLFVIIISLIALFFSQAQAAPTPVSREKSAAYQSCESNPSKIIQVGWPDVVRLVEKHPRVVQGQLQIEAFRGAKKIAGEAPNPTLETTLALGQERYGPGERLEWGLALHLPLSWIATRGSKLEAANAEMDVAEAEAKKMRRDVLLKLQVLFWNAVYQQARVQQLELLFQEVSRLKRIVKLRVRKGEARPIEETRVEVEAGKLAGEVERAHASLEIQKKQLQLWLGDCLGKNLILDADLSTLPKAVDLKKALSRVSADHPAIIGAKASVRARSKKLKTEKRERIPSIDLTMFTDHELDRRAYGVGLEVGLPLWNWNIGRIQEQRAQLASAQKELQAKQLEVASSVLEAHAACQSRIKYASRYKNRILPFAEKAADTVERSYQLGEANLLEVIDARRTLLQTRQQFLEAITHAHLECNRLRLVIGEE